MHPLIVVIYDGIGNSVFQGQVLTPLLQQLQQHPHRPIHLVSFERNPSAIQVPATNPIIFHLLPRLPFLGRLSLLLSTRKLKALLKDFPHYELLARGPLAGFVCLKALSTACAALTIRARGLLEQEYAYAHKRRPTPIHWLWHTWRQRSLRSVEAYVYGSALSSAHTTIEAVSDTLKRYLISTYTTPEHLITIASKDIPASITFKQRAQWRKEVRALLSIHPEASVFCYNGSAKAWQCPEMTVSFFRLELKKNPASVLVVLTQDQEPFRKLLQQAQIPETHYRIATIEHKDMYRYLSAGDMGILFREASLVNWVSRPTKALEYRAVGLHIVHNNTVGILAQRHSAGSLR